VLVMVRKFERANQNFEAVSALPPLHLQGSELAA